MTSETLCPNRKIIEDFIHEISRDWQNDPDHNGLFEVRCLGEHRNPVTQRFALHACDEAVDLAVNMNDAKLNIYMTINPISNNAAVKAAKDADILRAHYTFVDADDQSGLSGLNALAAKLEPDIIVITGTIPHERRHAYWRLLEPCTDLDLWRSRQLDRAERYQTDKAVTYPSRLMRVDGTVSYPNTEKLARGYVPELTTMKLSAS
jgi:hypothetical protein